jgi:putative membrane protein insertion efficiency factor
MTGRFLETPLLFPKRAVLLLIRVYQRTISPDHGLFRILFPFGACKFRPTCSEYMYTVVDKLGIIRGLPLGIGRIFRCTPWAVGGEDLPPLPPVKT